MAELKTKKNDASVDSFLAAVPDEQSRQDCQTLAEIMTSITRAEPEMWGDSIVGFGSYHYRYASGREGDWFLTGFSPRKQGLSIYLACESAERDALLAKLGKHKMGKSCLTIRRLGDVHLPTLKRLIRQAVRDARRMDQG